MTQPALAAGRLCAAALIHFGQHRIGQLKPQVELVQVVGNLRIIVGIDDGDGRARAVTDDRPVVERDIVEAVGLTNLRRRVAGGAVRRLRCSAIRGDIGQVMGKHSPGR